MTWDTNKIISFGLVLMGIIAVSGWLAISWKTGTSTGTEIPIGIISGLVGVLTGKGMAEKQQSQPPQSHAAQALGQVADVASQGPQIATAIDGLKDVFKK